ncbi:hypothetical protein [Hymenobacter terrenus]|uniref:hypothetical protein n=1 Tax=Hymenobacter terrenus TaxID=1629124 RepID=UPI000AC5C913|nr:hypothetical protein [Hymenobacter terrenus]
MTSFAAELRVDGHVLPVLRFFYQATQATNDRGRVVAKVHHQPVEILLNVPDGPAYEMLLV